nr:IS3 family transposase [Actinospica durhamensis]
MDAVYATTSPHRGFDMRRDGFRRSSVALQDSNGTRVAGRQLPGFWFMPSRRASRRDLEAALADARGQLRRQEHELRDLREEADLGRKSAETLIHHAPARERFTFIHTLRNRFAVRRICRIIATDHAGYFAWVRAEPKRTARNLEDRELLQLITEIHTAHPAYGAERVTRELKNQGTQIGPRRVSRLMRENGIAGITRRKRRNLTKPDKRAAAIPDLLQRNFTAPMPGLKLTGDISCLRTSEGWIYLVTVIDLCSKELIGWAIAAHMRTSLVADAMTMAHGRGLTAGNAIMHTDRGSQGGFNRSSQRLDSGGESGGCRAAAAGGSPLSGADSFAGAADGGLAGGPGSVLGGDRGRGLYGGRGRGRPRVCAGGVPLVSSRWRSESAAALIHVGPVSVVY